MHVIDLEFSLFTTQYVSLSTLFTAAEILKKSFKLDASISLHPYLHHDMTSCTFEKIYQI